MFSAISVSLLIMDISILNFLNFSLANPILDVVMVGLTYAGLAALPIGGLGLYLGGRRKLGTAVLVAIAASFALTMAFQFLALRPRPIPIRLIIPTPGFPSFPSGHAAIAFAVAVLLALVARRRAVWAAGLLGAAAIAFSRVYLGVHYPSDLVAGALLGASVGAAVYGVRYLGSSPRDGLRWLVWVQLAIALTVTMMAYLEILPERLLAWRYADKVFHFILVGLTAFWLNLWETRRDPSIRGRRITIPLIVFVILVAGRRCCRASPWCGGWMFTIFWRIWEGLCFFGG